MSTGPATSQIGRSEQRAVSALSCLILLGGIVTVGIAVYMVVLCYTPLPWSDGWSQIFAAALGQNSFSLPWLWQQHNEHRLLIPKLFLGLDLRFFAANQKLSLAVVYAVQFLHLGLLSWSMRALGGWRGALWRTGTGLAALCLFCPTQWENLTWGFQTCFVLPPLFATLSFVGLLLYWNSVPSAGASGAWRFIALSVVAAIAATCSLANGLLLLPLLALAAIALRLRKPVVLTYVIAAVVTLVLYFHNYSRPMQNSNPLVSLRSPAKLLGYVGTYFGSNWTAGHSWDPRNLQIAPYLGLCGFAVLLLFLSRWRRMAARRRAFSIQLLLLALFSATTAVVTALGRAGSGNSQAFSSRYQTVALLFWFSLGGLALAAASQASRRFALPAVQALLVVVLWRGAILVHLPLRDAREHAFQQRAASAALLTGVDDREQIARAFPYPDNVLQVVPFMRERRLSIFAEDSDIGQPVESVVRIVNQQECQGALQSVEPIQDGAGQNLRITGWAWGVKSHKPATEILAAANGKIVGVGAMGDWRPVLRFDHPSLNTSFVGFTAYAKVTPPAPVDIYAVLPGSAQACQVAMVQP